MRDPVLDLMDTLDAVADRLQSLQLEPPRRPIRYIWRLFACSCASLGLVVLACLPGVLLLAATFVVCVDVCVGLPVARVDLARVFWWSGLLSLLLVLIVVFVLAPTMWRQVMASERQASSVEVCVNGQLQPQLERFVAAVMAAFGVSSPPWVRLEAGKDLTVSEELLTIGVGAVRSLTVGELAGVVAHEAGHLRDRVGVLVLGWLEMAACAMAYLRAEAEYLSESVRTRLRGGLGSWTLLVTLPFSVVLWALAVLPGLLARQLFFLCGVVRREGERFADRHRVALAGSDVAAGEMRKSLVERLGVPRDEWSKRGPFHPHPAERIENALAADQPPRFSCDLPAAGFIEFFDGIEKRLEADDEVVVQS